MSFGTITAAQRLAVRDTALQSYAATQPFAQTQRVPTAAELALITPVLDKVAAALAVAGSIGIPATSAVVANSATIPLQTSAGVASGNVTATVAASVVSNVKLRDTTGVVTNGQVITATGTGTTATISVVAGVVKIALK